MILGLWWVKIICFVPPTSDLGLVASQNNMFRLSQTLFWFCGRTFSEIIKLYRYIYIYIDIHIICLCFKPKYNILRTFIGPEGPMKASSGLKQAIGAFQSSEKLVNDPFADP